MNQTRKPRNLVNVQCQREDKQIHKSTLDIKKIRPDVVTLITSTKSLSRLVLSQPSAFLLLNNFNDL